MMPMTMTERLEHARASLVAYFEAKGEPLPDGPWDYEDTDVSDLIADLLHLQKRLGMRDTQRTLQTAMLHLEAEEEEAPHFPCAMCTAATLCCLRRLPGGECRNSPDDEPVCSSRCQSDQISTSPGSVV